MAWKAVKFKKRKIRWMSAHYRQNLAPEILAEFGHFILNLNWLGWIPTQASNGVSQLKIPRKPLEAVDTLDDLDGLIALQGSCRISATTGILGRLNQWIGKGYLWK